MSDGSKTALGHWRWYAPHRAIVLVGILVTLIALAGAFLGVANASEAESLTGQLTQRYLVLQGPVRDTRGAAAAFQVLAVEAFNNAASAATLVPAAEIDTKNMNTAYNNLEHLLASQDEADLAPGLPAHMAAFIAAQNTLGAFLAGQPRTTQTAHLAAVEEGAQAELDASLASLQTTISTQLTATADQAHAAALRARDELLWAIAIGLVVAGTVVAIITRHALLVEHEQSRQEAVQSDITRRIAFEASLQTALEMSRAEPTVFDVVAEALTQAAPDMRSELLLADSSKAHFQQVLVSSTQADTIGCGVMSPEDCPAASRSRNMVFPDSTALDACPNLQGRHCSALCVPMSIGGNSVGVFHVTAKDGTPPSDAVEKDVVVVARRASERLAMLRAFAVSQTQANSDSLTGLMTRRSLETAVRELHNADTSYAVAYGDLDHFKRLNDTFGHAAGDRALRTFSQVLRSSLRPVDLSCRYGGEEFVVILPECPVDEARQVLERVRERLAERVVVADLPPFTVSFGVASSDQADQFDDVVALADSALLSAKAGGRDRVVTADGAAEPGTDGMAVPVQLASLRSGGTPASREPQHR
ncbi:MAG TPA: GGDEF domain-containing protein [Acidimicrobiales bacterium]|nr:GGDEF domain-containing protein [Acidimicrobiales bacterium]